MWVWGPSCLLSFSPQAWTLQSDEWRADSGHAVQCVQGSGDPSGLFRAVRPTRLRLHPPPLALRQYSHPSLSPITPSVQAFAAFSCDRYGNKKNARFLLRLFFFSFLQNPWWSFLCFWRNYNRRTWFDRVHTANVTDVTCWTRGRGNPDRMLVVMVTL